jgi:PknH-like extracellular domain
MREFDELVHATAAQKLLTNYAAIWQDCAAKTLTRTIVKDAKLARFILGAPENSRPVTGLHNTNIGSTTGIYRAVGAKANVVVEVQTVGAGLTDQNITAVNQVLDKIPG